MSRKLTLTVIVTLILAALLVACGGQPQTAAPAPAQKPAEAPKQEAPKAAAPTTAAAAAAPTTAPAAPTTAAAAQPNAGDAGQPPGAGQAAGDDVVDAEFTEVKDDDKK